MSITVNHLTKEYGTQKAVNNISFSVQQGEVVGFLGPNGAGKSTTMKIITGYIPADGGTVSVCGLDVLTQPIEIKKKIGYLPESNPLYFDMYVVEYLRYIAGVHSVAQTEQRIKEVISIVGLTPEANKKIGQLSKGYKQRVGLAAALIHDPEVLILDEPTSGLDPNQLIEIREVIKRLGQTKTILFSSHILQEVQAICNRVIIINKGNLVADDSLMNLQQASNSIQHVKVIFKERIEKDFLQPLESKEDIEFLNIEAEYPESTGFIIKTLNVELLRKQLLELSLKNNWNIVSLQSESSSLEEIFRQLTQHK